MIKELYQYLTTPTQPYVRKMGFLKEAIAMEARYQRCQSQWQSHFNACQQAILDAVKQTAHNRTILILGAGSLKDIPLLQLSQQFEKVLLVDLLFLKSARQQAKNYPNIKLIEQDVTASLGGLFNGEIELKNHQAWLSDRTIDCVVSLNLATQLPILPVSWLIKHYDVDEKVLEQLGQQMVEQHLDYLDQFEGVKCLIADRQVTEFNAKGELTDQFDPGWQVVLPEVSETWQWQIAPIGEVSKSVARAHTVGVSIWH